jgi:hypothetical protein
VSVTETARRGLLASRFTPEQIRAHLLPREAWHPYPTADDRAGWEALPAAPRAATVAAAEARLGMAWPDLPATLFLEFARDGNRSRYEARHFERRVALTELALGECVEGRGRFLDDIVNGIWSICEESFWGVPAHSFSPRFARVGPAGRYPTAGLPDTAYPVIDLFAAETGALLAWVHYLLGARLGAALPVVLDRLEREVRARILEPYRAIDEWWWLGKNRERPVNNWNPWIHSNVLTMTLLLDDDAATRERTVARIVEGLDAFLAVYHEDGGCDEGASYWNRAGGSLFDCLDLLASASDGGLVAFDLPLVREIARYIYRVHIGGEWFVNFADGPARLAPEQGVLYPFGRAIGDERLMALGSTTLGDAPERKRRPSIGRSLRELFLTEELARAAGTPPLIREAWLPGVEVLVAREREGATDGLFLAAKGGHNAESHNHNDVGNFIVALDGRPTIIDAGVGVYTRQTFGPERYSIWTMVSDYHNLPLIDGHGQGVGRQFAAREVDATVGEDAAELTLDIAPAYPPEAGVRRWRRTLRLDRGPAARVTLREDFELAGRPGALALHLMAAGPVDIGTPGTLLCAGATRSLAVRYDPAVFAPRVEEIAIDDARLLPVWGERVYRVVLAVREPQARGEWTLTMEPATRS